MGWIAHYQDGKTLAESQGLDWKDIPKSGITSLQLSHKGITHTLGIPAGTRGVFQQKIGITFMGATQYDDPLVARQIGAVVNNDGDCIILEIKEKTGDSKVFVDNIKRMKMNMKLHGINLEVKHESS